MAVTCVDPTSPGLGCWAPGWRVPTCAGARLDPDGWVQARLTGATVDAEQALTFAAAHGLRIT